MAATKLSDQAPRALAELVRSFAAADEPLAREDPQQLYAGLVTALMRLVFLLFAEARGLLAPDPGAVQPASVAALFEQLRADANADANAKMDQRFGAWAQLLARSRQLFAGGSRLFDPDAFPFLDGRARLSDGAVLRVLEPLLVIDGERVAYGSLEVEQIGEIYEALMDLEIEPAPGSTPAQRPELQPSEARRRSGSHYTPRALSEEIVRTTLAPILRDLGPAPTPAQLLALRVCDPAMGSGAFLVEACRQLGDALARSWAVHGHPPELAALGEDPRACRQHACRLVAARCIYGVDKDPFAVELARLCLWLLAQARDLAFGFVDHALNSGDSLIGLGRRQIAAGRWDAAGPDTLDPYPVLDRDQARRRGDAIVSALIHATRPTQRERRRRHIEALLAREGDDPAARAELDAAIAELHERHGAPFHWELELPEPFERPNPGFDAIVGNPPFQGGRVISASHGSPYLKALIELYPGASGGTDLSAYFLRRAYALLREGGCFGLITTNTISQGDTRAGGLAVLRAEGANLYDVRRRVEWPGAAAVIVSVIHCRRGPTEDKRIDGAIVDDVTSFLMPGGPDLPPQRLARPGYRCFQGNIVLGLGFTFDDSQAKATPLAQMEALIEAEPRNRERIFPYLGGREVNGHPRHEPHRFVINFEEMSEAEARAWPELFALLEAKVYPERATKDAKKYPRMVHEWWKFWCYRSELYAHTEGLDQVLVVPLISKHLSICLLPRSYVISHKLAAFSLSGMAAFAILQSRVHEIWARLFSSTLGDGLNYSPTDCFETFPFPPAWQTDAALEQAGQRYYDYRAELMVESQLGLTKTYNRFHDPDEDSPEIVELRERHAAMDRAVLEAFGWPELAARARSEFQLEYEVADEGDSRGRARTKPWRYKWPTGVHDEVLARLLALNAAQHADCQDRDQDRAS